MLCIQILLTPKELYLKSQIFHEFDLFCYLGKQRWPKFVLKDVFNGRRTWRTQMNPRRTYAEHGENMQTSNFVQPGNQTQDLIYAVSRSANHATTLPKWCAHKIIYKNHFLVKSNSFNTYRYSYCQIA